VRVVTVRNQNTTETRCRLQTICSRISPT
jgi:hypothetical protein